MKHSSLLITGTDTGIGKTTVACAIAAALRRRGREVGAMKPVETGCAQAGDGTLVPADALQLRYFAGRSDPLDTVCPYRFREPLAPAVAARRAGQALDLDAVAGAVTRFAESCEVALVEGAGGLLAPLADSATFADLTRRCGLAVLVVVGNRLGALNHAQLTVRWARSAGLSVVGYAVNTLGAGDDVAARTNVEVLGELLGPPLGVFPWLGAVACTPAERERLADAAERTLDLAALCAVSAAG